MRAHVKKEDGRVQAYGWSLPAVTSPAPSSTAKSDASATEDDTRAAAVNSGNMPVPVPVYCRPLMEKEPGMKVRLIRLKK